MIIKVGISKSYKWSPSSCRTIYSERVPCIPHGLLLLVRNGRLICLRARYLHLVSPSMSPPVGEAYEVPRGPPMRSVYISAYHDLCIAA